IWVVCIAAATSYFVYRVLTREIAPMLSRREEQLAIRQFGYQREHLEARFSELALAQNTPHDFRSIECDWKSEVSFARDRMTGCIHALVSVDIILVPAGEALHTPLRKKAVAVFHFQNGAWGTRGVALFNQTPADAVEYHPHHYQEIAAA
ncbi:MAG: hypothetical protein KDA65_15015, partial [Planctomycetaceae bacterium]|nr:hypothetical protein [Planctomycetaceae bacterium]